MKTMKNELVKSLLDLRFDKKSDGSYFFGSHYQIRELGISVYCTNKSIIVLFTVWHDSSEGANSSKHCFSMNVAGVSKVLDVVKMAVKQHDEIIKIVLASQNDASLKTWRKTVTRLDSVLGF